jgi:hypothetical protein
MGNPKKQQPQNPAKTGDAKRDGAGRFGAGNNANPGGRPRKVAEVQEYAGYFSIEAVDALVKIMRKGRSDKERRQAALGLLDRACGRPAQPIGGVPGSPVGIQAGGTAVLDILRKLAGDEKA